ncbi:MAG TPA: glycosyltransferase family 4 protein [Thermoanaerobaculia bacterium]|jgi:colanic acid biosynthesis glycosyl transferase WcaI|nr:glycosyltransferase family 4 protein [Thermoanaerobaculia bacterium]
MRIAIHSQYYPPEMGAPQARLSHLAGEFARHGHEVVVLTAFPNYPKGRVEPGYGGLFRREERDGISIIRTWIRPSQSVGLSARLKSYFSFVLSSLVVGWFTLGRLDVLITESPPLFLGIAGYLLAWRTGARWIFNVSDLWPESAVHLGAVSPGWGLDAAYALEGFCYRRAWLVTGQSAEILENIRRRFPAVRTYHLSNGVDTRFFEPGLRDATARRLLLDGAPENACVALYAGLHGVAQGLDQILDAAETLRDLPPVRFVLVGDGPEKQQLVQAATRRGLQNVRFLDALPREAMPALMASADLSLVPLKMSLPGAVPSKIYEAMGAGVPLLLIADGEAATLVRRSEAGMVVAPGDTAAVASAVRTLASDPALRRRLGKAGREAALRDFDRRGIADRFIGYLEGEA